MREGEAGASSRLEAGVPEASFATSASVRGEAGASGP
jgi:hypothetical protein